MHGVIQPGSTNRPHEINRAADRAGETIVRRAANVFRDKGRVFSNLEHVPEKWIRFSDKDMLPKFLKWREFFSIR